MTLYTNCILVPRTTKEGRRISVMSRHTLNDGKTPHHQITPDLFDEHLVSLAPPPLLIGDYLLRNMTWYGFERRYLEFLMGKTMEIDSIARRAVEGDVTLLCIEPTADKCHRKLLAEECRRLSEYSLEVVHL